MLINALDNITKKHFLEFYGFKIKHHQSRTREHGDA
jgi:hypothetical protein